MLTQQAGSSINWLRGKASTNHVESQQTNTALDKFTQPPQSSSRTAVDARRTAVVVVRTGRRQGRLDEDDRRPTGVHGSPTTTPGGRLEHLFFLNFYFLIFNSLTCLDTVFFSLCNFACCSRRPSTPSRTSPSQSVPSKDETVSSFVFLTPSRPRTRLSHPSSSSPRLGRTGRLDLVSLPSPLKVTCITHHAPQAIFHGLRQTAGVG